jgi:hypothetical protein
MSAITDVVVVGGSRKMIQTPQGTTVVIDPKASGGSGGNGNFNIRGLWVPGTSYSLYDAVILGTGTATGVYWSTQNSNTNAPDSGTGWLQIATCQGQWL